ncbi:MAG: hypothetical protein RLZZ461_1967, partial [Planctomycetota bacterium]
QFLEDDRDVRRMTVGSGALDDARDMVGVGREPFRLKIATDLESVGESRRGAGGQGVINRDLEDGGDRHHRMLAAAVAGCNPTQPADCRFQNPSAVRHSSMRSAPRNGL